MPAEEIVHKGVGMAFDFIELGLHVQDVGGRVEIEDSGKWRPPDRGVYKLNLACNISLNSGEMGVGILARDSSGLVMVASTMKMLSVGDSLQAHAMAVMEALQLLFDVGL